MHLANLLLFAVEYHHQQIKTTLPRSLLTSDDPVLPMAELRKFRLSVTPLPAVEVVEQFLAHRRSGSVINAALTITSLVLTGSESRVTVTLENVSAGQLNLIPITIRWQT